MDLKYFKIFKIKQDFEAFFGFFFIESLSLVADNPQLHLNWDHTQRLFDDNLMILFNRFLILFFVLLCKIDIDR